MSSNPTLSKIKLGNIPYYLKDADVRNQLYTPALSESGSIVNFISQTTLPVTKLIANIEPIQSGSGDPSPDNIRPISGWTGCNVFQTRNNIFGGTTLRDSVLASMNGVINYPDDKCVAFAADAVVTQPISQNVKFKEQTSYTFIMTLKKSSGVGSNLRVYYTDGTGENIPNVTAADTKETVLFISNPNKTIQSIRKNNSSGTTYLYYEESGVFEGALTVNDFTPYSGNTYHISWETEAGTVYGGTLDVLNGVLVVDMAMVDLGTLTWNLVSIYGDGVFTTTIQTLPNEPNYSNLLCSTYRSVVSSTPWSDMADKTCKKANTSKMLAIRDTDYTDAATFKSAMSGVQLVYELATPVTYQLTPQQINAFLGENNIWADTGDVEVEYQTLGNEIHSNISIIIYTVTLEPEEWTDTTPSVYTYSNTSLKCGKDGTVPLVIDCTSGENEYALIDNAIATAGVGIVFTATTKPTATIEIRIIDFY